MDGARFDRIAAELARRVGRRRLVGLVLPGWLATALGFADPVDEADARGRKRGRRGEAGQDRRDGSGGNDGGRNGDGGPDGPSASAPRRKKKCKGGKKRCGRRCVDLKTDPANCGACGNACPSGQGCGNGACTGSCDPPNQRCGAACVNTQNDNANCGTCGNACGSGKSCQGGQCVAGCGDGQILCNGVCVASVGAHPCCSQADCGPVGPNNQIACDTTRRQCRCNNPNHGICERTPDKRGICNTCCLGGNPDTCPGDFACNGFNFCTCGAGYHACPGGSFANRCAENVRPDGTTSDPKVCDIGNACVDCTQGGTRPYMCCWGRTCIDATGYPSETTVTGDPFCVDCRRCGPGSMCCNKGPGTATECVTPINNKCP